MTVKEAQEHVIMMAKCRIVEHEKMKQTIARQCELMLTEVRDPK